MSGHSGTEKARFGKAFAMVKGRRRRLAWLKCRPGRQGRAFQEIPLIKMGEMWGGADGVHKKKAWC